MFFLHNTVAPAPVLFFDVGVGGPVYFLFVRMFFLHNTVALAPVLFFDVGVGGPVYFLFSYGGVMLG